MARFADDDARGRHTGRLPLLQWKTIHLRAPSGEFLVNVQELLGLQDFNLGADLVPDRTEAALAAPPAIEAVTEAAAAFGEVHVGGGDGFAQVDAAAGPGEEVAGPSEADGERVAVALERAPGEHVEEFGVQRPGVEADDTIRDPGPARGTLMQGIHTMAPK